MPAAVHQEKRKYQALAHLLTAYNAPKWPPGGPKMSEWGVKRDKPLDLSVALINFR